MLFHYHFWTPYVEETEEFYKKVGFTVSQRFGKHEGKFKSFNPPLDWNDFRDKNILFRIVEVKKGNINITFGYGKRVIFDHIGFLVSLEEHNTICKNADKLQWRKEIGERRSFISTPYNFKIELQTHLDAVDPTSSGSIEKLLIVTKTEGLEEKLSVLFDKKVKEIKCIASNEVTIKNAFFTGELDLQSQDPNGVSIHIKRDSTQLI